MSDLEKMWYRKKEFSLDDKLSSSEEIFKKEADTFICEKCRGRGYFVSGGKTFKCEECTGVKKKDEVVEIDEKTFEVRVESLGIPSYYRGKVFEPEKLKLDEGLPVEIRKNMLMDFYIKNLRSIHDSYVLGKKLDYSYLIMAPQGNSKSFLVYASMVEAVKKGMTVAPYYDSEEIYKMYYAGSAELERVLLSDVCFIKMLPAFLSKRDTQAVKFVLDKRAKRGLPTVVTSRFNMGYLKGIEPHLENNFGVKNVDKGNYSKLKEVLGVYPANYSKY